MKTQIASVALALILIALAVIPAWMPDLRPRKRRLWMCVIFLLGGLGVVIVIFQAGFQIEETRKSEAMQEKNNALLVEINTLQGKNNAVQKEILSAVTELVAQKRLSPEDGQRLLKIAVEEAVGISDETKVELKPGQKRKP